MPSPSELAAAAALERAGFTSVVFVPAQPGRRTADLVAERGGRRWAVEVRGATRPLREDGTFEPASAAALPYPDLGSYLRLLWQEKAAQLSQTRASEACERALLLVVVEGRRSELWPRALEAAWRAAGSPESARFALACGGDLIAYPALD